MKIYQLSIYPERFYTSPINLYFSTKHKQNEYLKKNDPKNWYYFEEHILDVDIV